MMKVANNKQLKFGSAALDYNYYKKYFQHCTPTENNSYHCGKHVSPAEHIKLLPVGGHP